MVIGLAIADLSQRLGIPPSEVAVVGAEPVDWPDTSLGAPEPGMVYLQVITPGYKLLLSAEGGRYVYHSDHERVVFAD